MVVIVLRWNDGKLHRSWSVVESRRVAGKRVVQRPLPYRGGECPIFCVSEPLGH